MVWLSPLSASSQEIIVWRNPGKQWLKDAKVRLKHTVKSLSLHSQKSALSAQESKIKRQRYPKTLGNRRSQNTENRSNKTMKHTMKTAGTLTSKQRGWTGTDKRDDRLNTQGRQGNEGQVKHIRAGKVITQEQEVRYRKWEPQVSYIRKQEIIHEKTEMKNTLA